MKTFIYTYNEGASPGDGSGTPKTVEVWQIKRNKPVLIGSRTAAFIGEFALVMDTLQEHRALPAAAFASRQGTSARVHKSANSLATAGIADVIRL